MLSFIKKLKNETNRGFILPLTLFVCMIMLSISTSISVLLAKEIYFSRLTRLSQVAYYAADDGLMCATALDDKFTDPDTGLGIFQYDMTTTSQDVLNRINTERVQKGLTALTLNDIKCATAPVFNQPISNITLTPKTFLVGGVNQSGVSTQFDMRMDLGGGEFRCANITVNKTSAFRQIVARGFASCGSAYNFTIERAVVSNTVDAFYDSVSNGPFVFTAGGSWTVPAGVTGIKVWAIGSGGGGAGTPANPSVSAGSGAAGGVSYKTYAVTPGQVITYSVGAGGAGSSGASDGAAGSQTTVSVPGYAQLIAWGGDGGWYNNSSASTGGSGTGGDGAVLGGNGSGSNGNNGGAGGAGIGSASASGASCSGDDGAQANDVSGLFSVVTVAGYSTTAPGSRGSTNCSSPIVDNENGTNASGFGSGGGGAGRSGGNGGHGMYGGGGGGAAGGNVVHTGGNGGGGAVVISIQ